MTVTLISLAIASALAFFVMRLLREERRRSDARVAALTELAGEAAEDDVLQAVKPEPRPVPAAARQEPAAPLRIRSATPSVIERPAAKPRERRFDDFEIRPAVVEVSAAADLFDAHDEPSPWGRRLAVIGVMIFLAGGALFMLTHQRSRTDVLPAASQTAQGVRGPESQGSGSSATAATAPLELVSLRHTQQGDTLTISGLVQNPKDGTAHARLAVTAVVFGADGAFLTSGKAPLDYTKLAAGDESPFVITVPVNAPVARYRIGFRAEDGSVVAHVDRRNPDVRRAGL